MTITAVSDLRAHLQDPNLVHESAWIDGAWVSAEPGTSVIDPASGGVIAKVPQLSESSVKAAIMAADRAGKSWRATLASERAAALHRLYDLLLEHQDDLAYLMTREQGKPIAEARGEVRYAAGFVRWFAQEAIRAYGETIPSPRSGARILVLKQPVGVVAAITPWNFPLAMIARKMAPAVAAGCTVVVKPAPETPLSALALAELTRRAGFPPGVLNVVTGDAEMIGGVLTQSPVVRKLSFTGSTAVGKLLMQQSAATVKRVSLELGGNAPFIVFDDADISAALDGLMASKFRNAGQTCVCANRILVHQALYDSFAKQLADRVRHLKVGPGTDSGVDQGPLIHARAVKKVESHLAEAVADGASVLCGGGRHELGGTYFEPTVLTEVTPAMQIAREETFGPIAPLIQFSGEDEVLEIANATEFGLAAYVYTRDLGRAFRMSEALEYGMVGINQGMISTPEAPFGGVKQSGIGREGSHYGLDEFLEVKYVMMGGI